MDGVGPLAVPLAVLRLLVMAILSAPVTAATVTMGSPAITIIYEAGHTWHLTVSLSEKKSSPAADSGDEGACATVLFNRQIGGLKFRLKLVFASIWALIGICVNVLQKMFQQLSWVSHSLPALASEVV